MWHYEKMMQAETKIQRNLKALIDDKGTNAAALSKAAGLGQDAVRDILRGKSLSPRMNTLQKIARALDCKLSDLTGHAATDAPTPKIPLVATISAGNWGPALDLIDTANKPLITGDTRLASIKLRDHLFALTQVGDSMDGLNIIDGATLVCLPLSVWPRPLAAGDLVVAERQNTDGLYQTSLYQLATDSTDNMWLYPRSTNPRHQAPVECNGIDTKITAVLIQHANPLPSDI